MSNSVTEACSSQCYPFWAAVSAAISTAFILYQSMDNYLAGRISSPWYRQKATILVAVRALIYHGKSFTQASNGKKKQGRWHFTITLLQLLGVPACDWLLQQLWRNMPPTKGLDTKQDERIRRSDSSSSVQQLKIEPWRDWPVLDHTGNLVAEQGSYTKVFQSTNKSFEQKGK